MRNINYKNINEFNINTINFIQDYLISDGNFIYFYDKVFDTNYQLKNKTLKERKDIINHIIKEDKSRASILLVLVYTYLSKKAFSMSKDLIDIMFIEEKIPLIYEMTNIINNESSPYEILKHYSYLGITTKQIINKHKAIEVIKEDAIKYLNLVTYYDIQNLTKKQLKNIKQSLLYDWCKITNNEDKQKLITELYE